MCDATLVLPGLEARLVDAEIRQSHEELQELLAPEFREIGTSGHFHPRAAVFEASRVPGRIAIAIEDLVVQPITEDAAIVTYRATARDSETDKISISVRSSIWRRRTGRWQIVFHQGTRLT